MKRRSFLMGSGAAAGAIALSSRVEDLMARETGKFNSVRELLAKLVAEDKIPGAVYLVAQGDDVVVDTVGVSALGSKTPMRRDTIFRIASMTKAVTSAAVMLLVEEGKLALDAPAEKWLPEIANRKVLRDLKGPLDDTVPAQRPITVHDLLAFTLGFGILFDNTPPIQKEIDRLQLVNAQPTPMTPHDPDEWMRRFGTLPLMYQPGSRWMYNTGSLLQGVLVRRASGKNFDDFVNERILKPLDMRDTGFFVPTAKLSRYANCGFFTVPQTGQKTQMDADGAQSAYSSRPVFPSGAGGLVSTIDDYLTFAKMLLNGGAHKGRRLLSAQSVRAMTTNRLTPEQSKNADFFPHYFDNHGWAYGVGVSTGPDIISKKPGSFGWDGGFGTSFFVDPHRKLISIVMTQSTDFLFSGALDAYRQAVSQAVGD